MSTMAPKRKKLAGKIKMFRERHSRQGELYIVLFVWHFLESSPEQRSEYIYSGGRKCVFRQVRHDGPPRSSSCRGARCVALRRHRRARRRYPPRDRRGGRGRWRGGPHSGRGSRAWGRRRRRSGRCGRPRRPLGREQELQVLVQDAPEPGILLRRRERPRLAALRKARQLPARAPAVPPRPVGLPPPQPVQQRLPLPRPREVLLRHLSGAPHVQSARQHLVGTAAIASEKPRKDLEPTLLDMKLMCFSFQAKYKLQ